MKRRERERDALANNSLHTSNAIARFSSTFLRFGNIVDWHAGVCFTLEVNEYFIHQLSGLPVQNLAPATPIENLMLNTNNLLHANTTFTQYTTNTISTCNTNNTTTRESVQQVTEADWLTRARDSRCAEALKTQLPSVCRAF
jgi:hypothetical protein